MSEAKIVISAQDNASRVLAQVRADLQGVGATAARLGPILSTLGVSLSAGAAFAWVKSVTNGLDALNDLRDATGSSVENLSALEDIAARTGTTFDTVGTSLVKFNTVLKDAKPGNDAGAALKALNLDIKELQNLDPAEALRQTAVALAGFADDANKARLVQELFGRSVKEVAPFLKDLAEQGKLVATVTTEQAQAAEDFNKQVAALEKNAADLSRQLAGPLISALNNTAEAFRKSAAEGKGFFESISDRYLANVREFYELIGVSKPKRAQFIVDYKIDNESAAETARLVRRRSVDFQTGDGGKKGPTSRPEQGVRSETNALDAYVRSLERAVERNEDLSEVETARRRIGESLGRTSSTTMQQRVLALAAEIDKQKELKEATAAAAAAEEERIRIGRQAAIDQGVDNGPRAERLKALLSNTDDERFSRIREDVALLAEEFASGRLQGGAEQYIQAVQAAVGETGKTIEKTKSLVDDLGLKFKSDFEDAIVAGKSFQDVLKGIAQDILRIGVRKSITEPLGGFFTNALSGLFSFDGGGFTGSGPRAGGLDGKGGFLSLLHPRETVIDHTKGGSAAGTVVVNINQQVGDIATVSLLQKSNEQLVRQLQAGLMRSQNYGGAAA